MKKRYVRQGLSLILASSIFFTDATFGYTGEQFYFGYDVDNNKEYMSGSSSSSGFKILNFINRDILIDDVENRVTVAVSAGRQSFKIADSWFFYGGYSLNANNVEGYTLILDGIYGNGVKEVYGARTGGDFNASLNKLVLKNKSKAYEAYGARVERGDAISNEVEVENSEIGADVYGGRSADGVAMNNTVVIKDNSVIGNNAYGGYSRLSEVSDNNITIEESTANNIYGGLSVAGDAIGNNAKAIDTVVNDIYGGYAGDNGLGTINGEALSNTVELDGANAANVYGGVGLASSGNKVYLKSSTISNNLAGANIDATASGNELILLDGGNRAKNVFNFDIVNFGDENNKLDWKKDETVLSADSFLGDNIGLKISNIKMPEDFSYDNIGEKMTLIEVAEDLPEFSINSNKITTAGIDVLSDLDPLIFNNFKGLDVSLDCVPVQRIFLDENSIVDEFRAKVSKIVFGNVEWKQNDEALIKEDKLDFNNADVDTQNINFTNVDSLEKNDSMILVENFGDTAGTITGDSYKIKTTLEGKGKAKVDDTNLIFVIETAVKKPETDEPKTDEPKTDEPKTDEPKTDEPKTDEPKTDEPKTDEPKTDEPKTDEPKTDEPKTDEPKTDEPKTDEPKTDEPKTDEPKTDEPKTDEPKTDEPKTDEPKTDEPKTDEPKTDEPKTDEPKTDEPKTDEPKTDEPKTDEPKTDEPKTDEPKTDEPKTEGGASDSVPVLKAQEQTHNTVMAMEASMTSLLASKDFIEKAMDEISTDAKNSEDGVGIYVGMGGGVAEAKTGSSIDVHNWSAILALGQERKLKRGTFSYGAFFEYGNANYSLKPDNGMSGSSKYTGGGVFAKWINPKNIYFEGSLRAGTLKDSASGILTDALLNRYGYSVNSNYFGAHIGVGKIYKYKDDCELDLYGKFFYTRRGGVSYEAGGLYNLDAVSSKVLKIGARYGKNKIGWNSYVSLSYAYEFDAIARGSADGYAIREATMRGGVLCGELGLRLIPSETSKWKSDIALKAHTGRSKGFGGHISISYLF